MRRLLFALAITVAAPATASDFYRSIALTSGDARTAIAPLERQARIDTRDECAMINLAVAYGREGRTADAAALYRRVLTLDNVEVDVAGGGIMWSHDVARAALKPVAFTAR